MDSTDFRAYSALLLYCFISFSLTLLALPSDALSAYRIVLKNGSSIIVESYKKIDHRIQFFKSGGMMEIDSADIVEIKEVSTYREEEIEKKEEQIITPSPQAPPEREDEENLRARLEEIQREKEIIKKESEEIAREIEKLNQEIRKEGRVLAIRKKRELEKRKEELEKRVNELNARIEDLNREEDELLRKLWKY